MWSKPATKHIVSFLALAWAAFVYVMFFKVFSFYPGTASAVRLGIGIIATLVLYSVTWYLIKGRRGASVVDFSELPGLIAGVLGTSVGVSFVAAATRGDFRGYFGHNLQEIVYLAGIILAAFYVGDLLLHRLRLGIDGLERVFLSVSTGLGIMAVLVFLAGAIGAIYTWPFRILTLVPALLGAYRIGKAVAPGTVKKLGFSVLPNPLSLGIAVLLGLSFIAAWIPTWNYDSLLYHIAVPKFYMLAHKIYYVRDFMPADYPLNGEMLFMLAMVVKDDTVAQLVSYFMSVWLLLGAFVFARRFYSYRAGVISVTLLLTVSVVINKVPVNNNDTVLALFTLAAVYALVAWWETRTNGWFYLSGLMLGVTAGSKYSGFFTLFFVGLLAIVLMVITKRKEPDAVSGTAKMVGVFAVAAFVGVGPWLIKNFLFTGNPVYPMFVSVFGGRDWMPPATQVFQNTIRNANVVATGTLGNLAVLWQLTIREPSEMTIGPALLAFLPFAFKRDQILKGSVFIPLLAAAGFLIPWTLLLAQVARFAIPGLVLLTIVIAAGIDRFAGGRRIPGAMVALMLGVAVLANTFVLVVDQYKAFDIGLALTSHREFTQRSTLARMSGFINGRIPADKKIAMVIDNRAYYLNKRPILMLNPLNNGRIDQIDIKNPDELMRIFKSEKVDYVFATDEIRKYTYALPRTSPFSIVYRPMTENLDLLIKEGRLKAVLRTGDFWLYKING
ncbi:MAG: ArnT family glycosyltransferase [Candidatus Aquicultor sp.]